MWFIWHLYWFYRIKKQTQALFLIFKNFEIFFEKLILFSFFDQEIKKNTFPAKNFQTFFFWSFVHYLLYMCTKFHFNSALLQWVSEGGLLEHPPRFWGAPKSPGMNRVKSYKQMVRPLLEYAVQAWNPILVKDIELL